jgi:predicted nucleotidyltransferase
MEYHGIMQHIYRIDEIQKLLSPIFASEPIYRVILFGSYAKGKATINSDIDIVIDSRGELHGLRFYGVLESITEATGKSIDLIEISEIRPNSAILENIKQGVILYER